MTDIGQSTAKSEAATTPWVAGLLFSLVAALSYACVPALARIAYDGGSDPLTVAFMRSLMGTTALVMMILIFRRPILLPRKAWGVTVLATLSWFVTNVSYLAAIYYLPIGLASLLLFCFPFLAALLVPLLESGAFVRRNLAALVVALGGLGLALASVFHTLPMEGLCFGLLAAAGATVTALVSRRLVALHDVFSITVYVNIGGAVILGGALALLGGFSFPFALSGWGGMVGAGVFYAIAIVIQFAAIDLTGPARTGVVAYAEPLITIALAAVILGELLAPEQFLGALVMTAALVFLAWRPATTTSRVDTTSR